MKVYKEKRTTICEEDMFDMLKRHIKDEIWSYFPYDLAIDDMIRRIIVLLRKYELA